MSTQGQGDGGVYVSTQGPASYGLGTDDYEVNIIKDCFGVERVDEYLGKGNLDVILIYGCTAAILDQTPGGRDNAKMFSKSTFGCLSLKHANGNYFLRPDRILGAFKVDHSVKFVLDESNMNRLDNEIKSDHKAVETLTLYETMTRKNISRVDDALNTIRKLTTPIHDTHAVSPSSKEHHTKSHHQHDKRNSSTLLFGNALESFGKKIFATRTKSTIGGSSLNTDHAHHHLSTVTTSALLKSSNSYGIEFELSSTNTPFQQKGSKHNNSNGGGGGGSVGHFEFELSGEESSRLSSVKMDTAHENKQKDAVLSTLI